MSDRIKLIKSVGFGTICGLLTTIILMCVLAVILLKTGLLPQQATDYIMAVILGLGALAGGFVATKLNHGAGLIAGSLTGTVMLFAVILVSVCSGNAAFSVLTLIKLAAAVIFGALGGLLGIHEKRKF